MIQGHGWRQPANEPAPPPAYDLNPRLPYEAQWPQSPSLGRSTGAHQPARDGVDRLRRCRSWPSSAPAGSPTARRSPHRRRTVCRRSVYMGGHRAPTCGATCFPRSRQRDAERWHPISLASATRRPVRPGPFVHDTGGLIGLRWACNHPDAVAGMVITNTGFFPDHEWLEIANTVRTPIVAFRGAGSRLQTRVARGRSPFPLRG